VFLLSLCDYQYIYIYNIGNHIVQKCKQTIDLILKRPQIIISSRPKKHLGPVLSYPVAGNWYNLYKLN